MTDMFNVTQAFEGYSFLHAVYYFATLSSNMVESGFRTTLCDAVSQPDDIWEKVSKLKEIAEEYVGLSANGASISYANNLTFTPEKNWRSLKWQPCT